MHIVLYTCIKPSLGYSPAGPYGPSWDRLLLHILCLSSSLECIDNSI